jgi:hypothetical protein
LLLKPGNALPLSPETALLLNPEAALVLKKKSKAGNRASSMPETALPLVSETDLQRPSSSISHVVVKKLLRNTVMSTELVVL